MIDLTPYLEGYRERQSLRSSRLRLRRERILEAARRLGPEIAREFGLMRVLLFGSWAWGRPHERSDVDLVVEGLEPELSSRAAVIVEKRLGEALGRECPESDLHRIEDLPDWVRERIDREGIVLHARP